MLTPIVLAALGTLVQLPTCAVTPTESLLPNIIGDASGADPAWVVAGGAHAEGRGMKTVWIFKTGSVVRVTGRDVATGASVRFQRHGIDGAIENEMVIEKPRRESVLPGGAARELLDTYAFITSYVFYPGAGCYQFDVDIERTTRHITVQVK